MVAERNWWRDTALLGLLTFFGWGSLAAQGKFSGYMFGDFYYVAANHDSGLEDQNGFWFRRIYFTYDHDLGQEFSIRMRTEMASKDYSATSSKIEPFVKDAYLKWKVSRHSIILGLSPTPTWDVVEKVWGYRSVEKAPLDLQKFGSSRDLGLAFKGSLDRGGKLRYHAMVANGEGVYSETSKGKNVLCSLGFRPNDSFILEIYSDWQSEVKGEEDSARFTVQGFAAYSTEKTRTGVLFAQQTRQGPSNEDQELQIAALFSILNLNEKVAFLVRYDKAFDPNPLGDKISYIPFDKTAKPNFLLIGLDFRPHGLVSIVPNVEYVFYDETDGFKPDSDLIARVTFYYKWK